MKTSVFLDLLRTHAGVPLLFRAGGRLIPPGYHLTEVKRVAYETMDCGALTHRWSESQFEVWAPPRAGGGGPDRGPMPADKFLHIVDRVQRELPLDGDAEARIQASFDGQPAALHAIRDVTPGEGQLWVELTPDRTRCKAAERRAATVGGGCCGTAVETETAGASCAPGGCDSAADADGRPATACCA